MNYENTAEQKGKKKVQVRLCGDIHFISKKPGFNLTDYAGKVAITGSKDKENKQFTITNAKKVNA